MCLWQGNSNEQCFFFFFWETSSLLCSVINEIRMCWFLFSPLLLGLHTCSNQFAYKHIHCAAKAISQTNNVLNNRQTSPQLYEQPERTCLSFYKLTNWKRTSFVKCNQNTCTRLDELIKLKSSKLVWLSSVPMMYFIMNSVQEGMVCHVPVSNPAPVKPPFVNADVWAQSRGLSATCHTAVAEAKTGPRSMLALAWTPWASSLS